MPDDQAIHTLVPLAECKTALGYDDRDDDFTHFLLVAASFTAESHLFRRIIRRTHTEYYDSLGRCTFFLREYPLRSIISVHEDRTRHFAEETLIAPEYYYCTPDFASLEDISGTLTLIPPYRPSRGEKTIKIVYEAGYDLSEIPADLKEAVIELVAWNRTRYQSHRIGITSSVRGSGKETEGLEPTIPEHVRTLLEPYRRRTL